MSENVQSNTKPKLGGASVLNTPSKGISSAAGGQRSKSATASTKKLPNAALASPSPATARQPMSTSKDSASIAREKLVSDRIRKVAELKEKWAQEKERKMQLHKENRLKERERLQATSQHAAELRKKEIEAKAAFELAEKAKLQDLLATSLQERAHVAAERERQERERRRKSVLLNEEIIRKAREREEFLAQKSKQEEAELLASRRIDYLQAREAKKLEDIRRRESLVMRAHHANTQREISEELARKAAEEEKQLLEFRYESWKGREAAKAEDRRRARESLAFRLDTWRGQRGTEHEESQLRAIEEHQEMEARRDDWIAVQEYKRKLVERDRQSIIGRLDKWRDEKQIRTIRLTEEEEIAAIERELTIQAIEDAKEFEEKQKLNRRESLAYRLDKARKDKNFEEGQAAVRKAIEEEERRIALLDQTDVAQYKQKMVEARRQSLEYRNQTEFQERMRRAGEQEAIKAKEAAERMEEELAWKNVKTLQEQERERERKSIAFRLAEAKRLHELELIEHRKAMDAMHADLETKRLAWLDVQEHRAEEQERSRKSVAFRLESWRQQKVAEEMLEANKRYLLEEEARLREMDREALAEAKQQAKLAERDSENQARLVF